MVLGAGAAVWGFRCRCWVVGAGAAVLGFRCLNLTQTLTPLCEFIKILPLILSFIAKSLLRHSVT